jgi:hypothetical protein
VNRVQRVEGDEVKLGFTAESRRELDQIRKVARAPVALAAEAGQKAVDAVERLVAFGLRTRARR